MTLDDIDRILEHERSITPSLAFTSRVMRAVQLEAHGIEQRRRSEQPWVAGACSAVFALLLVVAINEARGLMMTIPGIAPELATVLVLAVECIVAVTWWRAVPAATR